MQWILQCLGLPFNKRSTQSLIPLRNKTLSSVIRQSFWINAATQYLKRNSYRRIHCCFRHIQKEQQISCWLVRAFGGQKMGKMLSSLMVLMSRAQDQKVLNSITLDLLICKKEQMYITSAWKRCTANYSAGHLHLPIKRIRVYDENKCSFIYPPKGMNSVLSKIFLNKDSNSWLKM